MRTSFRRILFYIFIIITALLVSKLWALLFIALFCILNIYLLMYDRYLDLPIDIELCTFSAILITMVFGIKWGILSAVSTKLSVIISNNDFNKNSIPSLIGYVLAALLADYLPYVSIVITGIIIVLIVNLYGFIVSKYVMQLSPIELIMYSSSNILFNIIMFTSFSNVAYGLLKIFIV